MTTQSKILPLLESVILDNETFSFPLHSISTEIANLFIAQEEFDYFMMQSYRKLKREYGEVIGHIFLTTAEIKLNINDNDVYALSLQEYHEKMENFLSTLENLKITKIEKNSPDGELLSAME